MNYDTKDSISPSFPRRRESSRANIPRSGQNRVAVPLRGNELFSGFLETLKFDAKN